MGEYWKPVNMTRREYINPQTLGGGLKLAEWNRSGSSTRERMKAVWPLTDDVRAISDYGNVMQLCGEPSDEKVTYDDVRELTDVTIATSRHSCPCGGK